MEPDDFPLPSFIEVKKDLGGDIEVALDVTTSGTEEEEGGEVVDRFFVRLLSDWNPVHEIIIRLGITVHSRGGDHCLLVGIFGSSLQGPRYQISQGLGGSAMLAPSRRTPSSAPPPEGEELGHSKDDASSCLDVDKEVTEAFFLGGKWRGGAT